MVVCCVPGCGTDSWKCDGSVTFYDFPSNPDFKAKWIKQINSVIKSKDLWFPPARPVICSKHFLHTDFKGDTDALKPRSLPTVFGHRYIGQNPESNEINALQEVKKSPLIVKVLSTQSSDQSDDVKNESCFRNSVSDFTDNNNTEPESDMQVEVNEQNLLTSTSKSTTKNNHPSVNVASQMSSTKIPHTSEVQHKNNTFSSNSATNNLVKKSPIKQTSLLNKKNKKKESSSNDLIEIGPNTFLKINPDIIKVNRKQTPSGNTVLQFLMDQKLAKNYTSDLLPKLIQGVPDPSIQSTNSSAVKAIHSLDNNRNKDVTASCQKQGTVQHVLGHVVDNHVCEDSCADLTLEDDDTESMDISQNDETSLNISPDEISENQVKVDNISREQGNNTQKSVLEKAPVLLTTSMPLSHCFIDRPKYILQLKQKNRQIASLKLKMSALNKKIEELEDKCIVQEKQLSYSFIKRLKAIRKNAAKGDPCASYILEQIRSYSDISNSKMRWSDSTLTQCAIWCRKAPYAYEYFKKAGFFKLPCLGTVKRFMKKHPELKFQKTVSKSTSEAKGDESSSDFDFDDSDGQNANGMSEDESNEPVACESMLAEMAGTSVSKNPKAKEQINRRESNEIKNATESISNNSPKLNAQDAVSSKTNADKAADASKYIESNGIPVTVDTSNLELQEIMLPSGEVVQCYSSNIVSGGESGQYFIIPNVSDQSTDHEYNVVPADSMPVLLQNMENSQLHVQQDQLIFIANSSEQVECSETEVTSA